MDPFKDLEKLRADRLPATEKNPHQLKRKWLKGWFVKGPISGEWISRAAKLPGKTLHVALAIQYERGKSDEPVKFTNGLAEKFGLKRRGTVFKSLRALETAGLIRVDRARGRCPRVVVISVEKS